MSSSAGSTCAATSAGLLAVSHASLAVGRPVGTYSPPSGASPASMASENEMGTWSRERVETKPLMLMPPPTPRWCHRHRSQRAWRLHAVREYALARRQQPLLRRLPPRWLWRRLLHPGPARVLRQAGRP